MSPARVTDQKPASPGLWASGLQWTGASRRRRLNSSSSPHPRDGGAAALAPPVPASQLTERVPRPPVVPPVGPQLEVELAALAARVAAAANRADPLAGTHPGPVPDRRWMNQMRVHVVAIGLSPVYHQIV